MKNLILLVTFIGSLAFMTSCSNDDDSVGSGNAALKITAGIKSPSSSKIASAKESASTLNAYLNFTSGYIWVSEIEFEGDLQSGDSVSVSIERFSKIDFATGIATPSLDDIIIPVGTYTDLELEIELRDEDAQPSIVMEGTYTHSNGSIIPIRFEFNSGEVFGAESDDDQPVVVSESQNVLSRIVFDPIVWFSVVSRNALDNANVNANGVIIISETSNASIFDLVADRLDESTESTFE